MNNQNNYYTMTFFVEEIILYNTIIFCIYINNKAHICQINT